MARINLMPIASKILIFTITIIILGSLINIVKTQTYDLDSKDYDNFKKRNLLFMATICNFEDTKCKNIRKVFDGVYKKIKSEHNLEIKFPFINAKTLQEKLWNEYTYEGFPVTYFVNQSDSEKEAYIGVRDVPQIYKYLKYKLIFPDEYLIEFSNEKEIIENIDNTPEKKALLIIGDFKSYPQFSFTLFQKAARRAGYERIIQIKSEEVIEKYGIVDFDLAFYNTSITYESLNSQENPNIDEFIRFKRLRINKNQKYESEDLAQLIMLIDSNQIKENLFSNINENTFEYALNYGLPTLVYLYSNKEEHLPNNLDVDLKNVASNYQNELIFRKGSINNKILKNLKFVKHYNITKNDLPLLLFTKKPEYVNKVSFKNNIVNFDDVEKYILKRSDLKKFIKENIQSYMTNNSVDVEKLSFTPEIVEVFIEKIKDNKYDRFTFHTHSETIQMNGENFVSVINEALEEENSIIVLMICPKSSKKYPRIRSRVERVFNKIYESNDKKIIFDEFDPFFNEMSFIDYNYYPTIAIIQKSKAVKKWKVKLHNGKLTTSEIVKFIRNSITESTSDQPLENEGEVESFEKENPLYAIHKSRYEGKALGESLINQSYNVGLKRKWINLKKNHIVSVQGELEDLQYPNYFEDDSISEEFEIDDDVTEKHLHKNADDEKKEDL